MTTGRDTTTRVVRSWLQADEHESADRVLDAVLDRLDTTPQRRAPWWPAWRLPVMNNTAKLAIAAAAVVVVALLGIRYLLPANVGGPGESPSPTAIPSPLALPELGPLEPGTYVIDDPVVTPRSFTLTVPGGWSAEEGFVTKGASDNVVLRDVYVAPWVITHVFTDACLWTTAETDSVVEARTPGEIVDALAGQGGGHEITGPTAVTLGGFPAQRFELDVPDDFDLPACSSGIIRLWPDAGPDFNGGVPILRTGQHMVIHIVDIDGAAVAIVASSMSDATSTDIAELEGVLATLRFAESPAP